MSENDGLTVFVCRKCITEAEDAYGFKTRCETSDAFLRSKAETVESAVESSDKKTEVYEAEMCDGYSLIQELSLMGDNTYLSDRLENEVTYDSLEEICFDETTQPEQDAPLDIQIEEFASKPCYSPVSRTLGSPEFKTPDSPDFNETFDSSVSSEFADSIKNTDTEGMALKYEECSLESSPGLVKSRKKVAYTCQFCKAIFRSDFILRKHLKKVHRTKYIARLPKAAQDADDDKEAEDDVYRCTECDFTTEVFTDLKNHMKQHVGDKPIFCDECNYRCADIGYLVKHKRKHSGDRPYACEKCPYRSARPYSLKVHMATHSTEKPHACQMCSFTCKLASGLQHHVARCHEGQRNHPCPTCGKRFFTLSHLKTHQRVHSGEKPHVCDKCGTAYAQKSNLQQHVATAHAPEGDPLSSRRKFPCDVCSYRANAQHTLRMHKLKHTGEKPAKCDLCDFKCVSRSALTIHKRRHAGETRYSCELCSYACYTMNRYKAHMRSHTGEKPFPCTKCHFRATTSAGLCKHMKSHMNEKKYACADCPYRANYKYNLTKHQRERCGKPRKCKPTRPKPGTRIVAIILRAPDNDEVTPNMDAIGEETPAFV